MVFDEFSATYREGSAEAVAGVSLTIEAGQKIGVVGRTGAGKTSLGLALFRILEASKGRILIDNVDISSLGLHQLRQKLTIIPQDAMLFAGSLKNNIDPFNNLADDQLLSVMRSAGLGKYVCNLDNGH